MSTTASEPGTSNIGLRTKLFTDVLDSLNDPSISHTLTVGSLIQPSTPRVDNAAVPQPSETEEWKGPGLTETDLRRFTSPVKTKLNTGRTEAQILEKLETTTTSIAKLLCDPNEPGDSTSDQYLLQNIFARLETLEGLEDALSHKHHQIHETIAEIHQVHPRLQQRLTHAISTLAPAIIGRNAVNNELLVMDIEASLVKISLIRARVQHALYNYQSHKDPELHMAHALSLAYGKLKDNERQMEDEELRLVHELTQFQSVLDVVDGGGKGFRQVVDDWARVKKETEECKTDLRRLGWTEGD